MTKEFKNYELISVFQSMGEFMQIGFSIDIGWQLKKNMRHLEALYKEFTEAEQELVSKYALKVDGKIQFDKESGQPKIYPANQTIFKTEHTELLNCISQVDILPIKYSELKEWCNEKGISVKSSLLFNLEFMIIDDSETIVKK